jgi:hypothetical protein
VAAFGQPGGGGAAHGAEAEDDDLHLEAGYRVQRTGVVLKSYAYI